MSVVYAKNAMGIFLLNIRIHCYLIVKRIVVHIHIYCNKDDYKSIAKCRKQFLLNEKSIYFKRDSKTQGGFGKSSMKLKQ